MYLLRTHAAEISLLNLIPSFLCNTEMRYSNDFPGARNLPHSHTSPTEFDSYAAGNRGNAAVASCSMHAYEQSARDARTEGRASSAKSSSLRSLNTPVYKSIPFVVLSLLRRGEEKASRAHRTRQRQGINKRRTPPRTLVTQTRFARWLPEPARERNPNSEHAAALCAL
jgi:hypothetical protein